MAVRRVRRIIRKIDPWTVLRVGLVLNLVGALVGTLGIWIAWSIAVQRGIPDDVVETLSRLTIAVTPDGELYFRVVVLLAIVWVIVMTGAMTLAAILYNLISDIVGGVELIMLEEIPDGPVAQPAPQRPVVHAPTTTSTVVNGDSAITSADTVEN
jgi:hypothetical protein